MTIDIMLSSNGSFLCFYVAYAMFMRLNLKETRFRTYVFKVIKIESTHVHYFYKWTQSGRDDEDDTVIV